MLCVLEYHALAVSAMFCLLEYIASGPLRSAGDALLHSAFVFWGRCDRSALANTSKQFETTVKYHNAEGKERVCGGKDLLVATTNHITVTTTTTTANTTTTTCYYTTT